MTEKSNGHANVAMDQAAADCFGALLTAIRTSADEWRMRAAEALLDRDDARAEECLRAIQRITEAADEVETVYHKWKDRWPTLAAAPATTPSLAPHTKRPGPKLRVHLNSKVIEYSGAAETFARTIEAIGIERVARLGKVLSGIALVGTSKATGYQQQFAIGEFYVCTHSNTQTKKRLLEEIASELRVPLRVEITSENQTLCSGNSAPIPQRSHGQAGTDQ
ncbi:MAG: hypothetical protein AAB403_17815 [Planctomycetota bacterium]